MPCDPPTTCCGEKPQIDKRPLLSPRQAAEVEALFKALANQTRLLMLHALIRSGELCVTELADSVNMKPQAVSNQLQRLVDKGMVAPRRNGNNIFYRIVDPCVVALLDRGLCLIEAARERKRHDLYGPADPVDLGDVADVVRQIPSPADPGPWSSEDK
jgi:ArsR family transcriptional regulator, lead/cadmium/zinc/bismuth-responsive transcriptional repressor